MRLPDEPGIYIFRDYRQRPIYIGRATSLKDRVNSYFSADLIKTRGPRIVDMVTKSKTLTHIKTDSVLEAVLLEGTLIKRYQPYCNVDEKDDKSSQYVIITDESWPRVFLERVRDYEEMTASGTLPYVTKKLFGPYPYANVITDALKILRRLFPFRDRKANDPRHERFYRAIGKSPMNDVNVERNARRKYLRTIQYLVLFFNGKKSRLRNKIEADMNKHAREMRFEEANKSKKLLYALDHISDISLIKADMDAKAIHSGFRIEAYDIAHLSGSNVVGAMTVSTDGKLSRSEYRKFWIKRQANNDTAALTEMMLRRLNHTEWTYPDLIVVDGNEIQMKTAESVLRSRRLKIPVIAVTKNAAHKADRMIGNKELIDEFGRAIIALNAESHRFAVAYHRIRRRIRDKMVT